MDNSTTYQPSTTLTLNHFDTIAYGNSHPDTLCKDLHCTDKALNDFLDSEECQNHLKLGEKLAQFQARVRAHRHADEAIETLHAVTRNPQNPMAQRLAATELLAYAGLHPEKPPALILHQSVKSPAVTPAGQPNSAHGAAPEKPAACNGGATPPLASAHGAETPIPPNPSPIENQKWKRENRITPFLNTLLLAALLLHSLLKYPSKSFRKMNETSAISSITMPHQSFIFRIQNQGGNMSRVRLLVGTKKGAFVFNGDAKRNKWEISGPFFGGWEIYHMKASPADPNRIYVSQSNGWFGQIVQRSDDGGKTWIQPGLDPGAPVKTPEGFPMTESNKFQYDTSDKTGKPMTTHMWYDGTPHPWEFKRIWHMEPSLHDPNTAYVGVEDAAMFRTTDGGKSWHELAGLRGHGTGSSWQPGAGGLGLHTIVLDPSNPKRMFIAISAAGAFRTDDGGATWKPINKGLYSKYLPNPTADTGHCVHRITQNPARPDVLFMQKHWDVMRSDDAGESWREVSGNLPTDFGFPIETDFNNPNTAFVFPIKSDSEHYPIDGKLRVYRSKAGGNEWEELKKGLPEKDCYVNILREASAVDRLDPCGIYFGTTGGQVFCSPDGGDSWNAVSTHLPAVLSVEVQTLA